MATVSVSPTPAHLSAMSSRRLPLTNNPNAANSPRRGASALASLGSKRVRSHAETQREESYGQPPPPKRQMLEQEAPNLKSPTRPQRSSKSLVPRAAPRGTAGAERAPKHPMFKPSEEEVESVRQWQNQTRGRFPNMVFYFESIPDDQCVRLAKQVTHLGAREEKFFSIEVTHVVTSRNIPAPGKTTQGDSTGQSEDMVEQPKTIDPSLLNRSADASASTASAKRKLLFDTTSSRRIPVQAAEGADRRPKVQVRNTDILHRAREMGKKIWSLEKLQKILPMLLEPDPYKSYVLGQVFRNGNVQGNSAVKAPEESNLLQLLQNERVHGPSDRDPTVVTKEMTYFKGPYLYVYDIEEKQKPIMVREYAKVADKKDGDWPQFRVVSQGRCPFVEDPDSVEKESRAQAKAKERVAKAAAVETAPSLKPPEVPPPKPVTGKRTLAEMQDTQSRSIALQAIHPVEMFEPKHRANSSSIDFRPQNAFTGTAKAGMLFNGEPVASGIQPSNVTSAIRSQMISSTTGGLQLKAGTSKEVLGLQRQVLQKNSTPAVSQDLSSRRMADMSHDSSRFMRSASLSRATQQKMDVIEEDDGRPSRLRRHMTAPVPQTKQRKRDPKPGYCENCQDKFEDFDDHIVSRKHRKFAEADDNWTQLDALLVQLKRVPKYGPDDVEWMY